MGDHLISYSCLLLSFILLLPSFAWSLEWEYDYKVKDLIGGGGSEQIYIITTRPKTVEGKMRSPFQPIQILEQTMDLVQSSESFVVRMLKEGFRMVDRVPAQLEMR